MRNIYPLIIIILTFFVKYDVQAQLQPFNPYKGTWQYEFDNKLFIVQLWVDGDYTKGHYKVVHYNNNTIGATIFTSRKEYNGDGIFFPPTIFGIISNAVLSGSVCDNTTVGNDTDCKDGKFIMTIQSENTATWKVNPTSGLKYGADPPFSIPTDVILTKVSNTVNFD